METEGRFICHFIHLAQVTLGMLCATVHSVSLFLAQSCFYRLKLAVQNVPYIVILSGAINWHLIVPKLQVKST